MRGPEQRTAGREEQDDERFAGIADTTDVADACHRADGPVTGASRTTLFDGWVVPGFILLTGADLALFAALIRKTDMGLFAAGLAAPAVATAAVGIFLWFGGKGSGKIGSGGVGGGNPGAGIGAIRFGSVACAAAVILLSAWLVDRLAGAGLNLAVVKITVTLAAALALCLVMFRPVSGRRAGLAGFAALAGVVGLNLAFPAGQQPHGLPDGYMDLYAEAPAPVDGPLQVYHLGHSLVGRDMPAMLAQLAGDGHRYGLQLGWGTSLNQHLAGPDSVAGFVEENDSPHFRPLDEALADPDVDALVYTEMVNLADAIRYHDTEAAVARLATEANAQNPNSRLYLFETWHGLEHDDWLERIARDRDTMWEPRVLAPAIRATGTAVGLIPAGTVMARLVSEVEATDGGIGGMTHREALFATTPEGEQDTIHLSDLGNYLVALTHYAVLYGKTPVGLPHELTRADGSPANAPSPDLAAAMQRIVDDVVQSSPLHR